MTKKLSVSDELHTLELAVDAARELTRHGEESPDDETRRLQPRIGAVLALIAARLHDFDRVVRGEVDPAMFMAAHSGVELDDGDDAEGEPEDIMLDEWTPPKRRANAEWEKRRAGAREKEVRPRRT
jgi:hypothetical protein